MINSLGQVSSLSYLTETQVAVKPQAGGQSRRLAGAETRDTGNTHGTHCPGRSHDVIQSLDRLVVNALNCGTLTAATDHSSPSLSLTHLAVFTCQSASFIWLMTWGKTQR
jgi:hypothetical protein